MMSLSPSKDFKTSVDWLKDRRDSDFDQIIKLIYLFVQNGIEMWKLFGWEDPDDYKDSTKLFDEYQASFQKPNAQ